MSHIEWTDDFKTNIPVIDNQHSRLVSYINQLFTAQKIKDKKLLDEVLTELIDYTVSHFSFEESLMDQAGYPFLRPHQKVHELFIKRVTGFVERRNTGEDITDELLLVLRKWLVSHIKVEDMDYSEIILQNIVNKNEVKDETLELLQKEAKRKNVILRLLEKVIGR